MNIKQIINFIFSFFKKENIFIDNKNYKPQNIKSKIIYFNEINFLIKDMYWLFEPLSLSILKYISNFPSSYWEEDIYISNNNE